MHKSRILFRGSKGYSWYNKFVEEGSTGFKKNLPPTPFNWKAPAHPIYPSNSNTETDIIIRPKAYFECKIDKDVIGRLTFELASDIVPITVQNFLNLCNSGKYNGTKLHQVIKSVAIMGGDTENKSGAGGHSSYPEKFFKDENFIIPHSDRGLLSMVSIGIHTNASQFYISLGKNDQMNGRCVVFGRLIEGEEVLKVLEKVFTFRGSPARDIIISSSGVL